MEGIGEKMGVQREEFKAWNLMKLLSQKLRERAAVVIRG